MKLNQDKTEIILFGSDFNIRKQPTATLRIGDHAILSQSEVRNLGAIFDSTLSMDKFVLNKCKNAMFYLRAIYRIRKSLDVDSTKTIVNAMVTSRIDFANSLLTGISQKTLSRLLKVQNCAARLITGSRKSSSITPVLKDLHWLPVALRIKYKVLVICFNCIQKTAPIYLCDLVKLYRPSRNLRSCDMFLLEIPKTKSKHGLKSFSVVAPTLWNALPLYLRNIKSLVQFRKALKTHLFSQY